MSDERDSSPPAAVLVARSIEKSYPTRGEPLRVLRDASLTLDAGDAAVILGPSGCGKSTFLSILGALEPPSRGALRVNGIDPFELNDADLARFRNGRIGFVFQDHHLLPQLTVLENVVLPALADAENLDRSSRAAELLERVGLSARLDHRPAELSGGERQRVAIARALINSPAIVLADEPTGNLDRVSATQVADVLLGLPEREGVVLVMVTHSEALASRFARRFEILDGVLRPQTQK